MVMRFMTGFFVQPWSAYQKPQTRKRQRPQKKRLIRSCQGRLTKTEWGKLTGIRRGVTAFVHTELVIAGVLPPCINKIMSYMALRNRKFAIAFRRSMRGNNVDGP